jgi:hypothetical protein
VWCSSTARGKYARVKGSAEGEVCVFTLAGGNHPYWAAPSAVVPQQAVDGLFAAPLALVHVLGNASPMDLAHGITGTERATGDADRAMSPEARRNIVDQAASPATQRVASHVALSGLRDPEPLAKLPTAEREDWEKFWADVKATLSDVSRVRIGSHRTASLWSRRGKYRLRGLRAEASGHSRQARLQSRLRERQASLGPPSAV